MSTINDLIAQVVSKAASTKRRRVMKGGTIKFMSAVTKPAQEGATVVLLKAAGDGGDEKIEKRSAMTSSDDGHQHSITVDWGNGPMTSGNTSSEKSASEVGGDSYGHSHPWIVTESGDLMIGMAAGHTHSVGAISKGDAEPPAITTREELEDAIVAFAKSEDQPAAAAEIRKAATALEVTDLLPEEGELATLLKVAATGDQEEETMPGDEKKTPTVEERLEKLEAANVRLSKERNLIDVEKAHYDGLTDDADKAKFLEKSKDERVAIVKAAADAQTDDDVVYKSAAGVEYKKADDQRLVEMAKRNDLQDKEMAKMRTDAELVTLNKRADDELGHLPGTTETRAALLKAVDAIPDEDVREKALQAVKAGDVALSKSFESGGHKDGTVAAGAEQELEALAKSLMKGDSELTPEAAFVKALDTEEGQEIAKRLDATKK